MQPVQIRPGGNMTHNVTDINADKLVCRRLFPDETPRSLYLFYRDHSEATQIKENGLKALMYQYHLLSSLASVLYPRSLSKICG